MTSIRTCVTMLAIATGFVPALAHGQGKDAPPKKVVAGVITLGTTREAVEALLGSPTSGWTINPLGRALYLYPDGTKIIFIDGRAISAKPNGLAEGDLAHGFLVERRGKQILIEPGVIAGVPIDGPLGALKHDAEDCFFMAPPMRPPYIGTPLLPGWPPHSWTPHSKCRVCY